MKLIHYGFAFILYGYVVLSSLAGGIALFSPTPLVGVSIIGASWLVVIGVGSIKAALLWYPGGLRRIGSMLLGLVLLGAVLWLSPNFTIGLFGYSISGPVWSIIGGVVAAVTVNRRAATQTSPSNP